jgi:hypothetical protein
MAAMRVPWLVAVIAVYVSLDVSNPLMPGAVTFCDGESVEARTDRFRADDDAPSVTRTPVVDRAVVLEPPLAPSRLTSVPLPARSWQAHVTRSHPPRRAPAPSPEDH